MKFINIRGQQLTQIGIGSADLGYNPTKEIEAIRYGINNGINVVDTAESYGPSEKIVGDALKPLQRDKIFLISKFLPSHATPKLERKSLINSLKRLKTDYLDLYLLHWRANADLAETVAGLESLKKEGLIRHWGVSNFDTSDMKDLFKVENGNYCFANQDLYNLTSRGVEYDLIPWQKEHNVGFLSYSPFHAVGWNFIRPQKVVEEIAAEHHMSAQQIMLAWIIRNHNVLPLPKAGNAKHVQDNIDALDITLSDDDLKRLDAAYPAPTYKMPLDKI